MPSLLLRSGPGCVGGQPQAGSVPAQLTPIQKTVPVNSILALSTCFFEYEETSPWWIFSSSQFHNRKRTLNYLISQGFSLFKNNGEDGIAVWVGNDPWDGRKKRTCIYLSITSLPLNQAFLVSKMMPMLAGISERLLCAWHSARCPVCISYAIPNHLIH